ncbi:MAG: alpha/beta fold hydrolase [Bacteriovoracales bacterium]
MKIKIEALEISYSVTGNENGPSIVFIHGFPFNQEMWIPQVELLQQRFKVITYDLRGHGKSGVGEGQYFMEYYVDDLITLLDHLKISSTIVCGFSMGGYIALRAMEKNPQKFKGLILVDTKSEADSNEAKIKRSEGLKVIKSKGAEVFGEGFLKGALTPETFSGNPELVEKLKSMIKSNQPLGIGGALLALATRTDTTAALSKISVPTLILVGEKDTITPPSASQMMKEKIPGSKLEIIQRAGHLSNLENSKDFNQKLDEFLAKF